MALDRLSLLEWLVAREKEEPATTISGRELLPRASRLCSTDPSPWQTVARAVAQLMQLECITWRYVPYPGAPESLPPHLLNDRNLQQVEDIMVTTSGLAYLASARSPRTGVLTTVAAGQVAVETLPPYPGDQAGLENVPPPVVFVSYSHDSAEHQDWVRKVFVNGLIKRAVDARMDVHELSYGDRIDAFMEDFINRCDHVASICTPNYAQRSASDIGGVGYEKQLIRRFMAMDDPDKRVVPVLRAGGQDAIPAYLGSRLYVDMRSDDRTEALLDELATVFYGLRVHQAPPIAAPPPWLVERLARRHAV